MARVPFALPGKDVKGTRGWGSPPPPPPPPPSYHTKSADSCTGDFFVTFPSPPPRLTSQERRAIRDNPAVIPKLGEFFVHDDRSSRGSGNKAARGKQQQQQQQQRGGEDGGAGSSEGDEEEDSGLGRWRADALPLAKKKNSGEQW